MFTFYTLVFWLQKLSILCFRHEEHHSSETPKPEIIDHFLHEDLVQFESEDPNVTKRDWKSILPKVKYLSLFVFISKWFSIFCADVFSSILNLGIHYQWLCTPEPNLKMHNLSLPLCSMAMKFHAKFIH